MTIKDEIEQFAALARKAGWEWCGYQESIPPVLPVLVIKRWGVTKCISFTPENFDPIKTAALYFEKQEKKMTETPKLNLRQKMVQIYSEIDHVGKYGENTKQNYSFVRAADVMRPIRQAFAKWGVYAETNYELLGTYDIKTNKGGVMHAATVKATLVLHDIDSMETLTISGLGDGADAGDKGIFKAQTGATKNALRNGTLLPDEADPEADQSVDNATSGPYVDTYTDFRGTEAILDFQEARHAAPRPQLAPQAERTVYIPSASPNEPQEASSAATEPSAISADGSPVGVLEAPENVPGKGDAYEEPTMPTEQELVEYRAKFKKLGDDLATPTGKLTSSGGLPVNRKLHAFLLSITGAATAPQITKAGWDDFFARVDVARANEKVGLPGITKLVNAACGLNVK